MGQNARTMSTELLDRAAATLRSHARGFGFDVAVPGDRVLLARQSGIPPDVLHRLYGPDAAAQPAVADLVAVCLALDLDAAELFSATRRDFTLVAVHPFFGGDPLHLSLPRHWFGGATTLAADLFYIRTDLADTESGLPARSLVIARRGDRGPQPGAAYVLERDAGYLIRRCTTRLPTGAHVMGPFQGSTDAPPVVLAPARGGRLHLVTADEPDLPDAGPWIVGRVLGAYQPEVEDAAFAPAGPAPVLPRGR